MKAAVGAALLALGCGRAPTLTAADVHPSLRCLPGVVEMPIEPLPLVAAHETPRAGQMTDEAVQAKRLFEGNRWAEAAVALGRVVDGATGDDEGNREIAAYQRGVALFNLRDRRGALEVFLGIIANHDHSKWRETQLWLFRFVTVGIGSDGDLLERAFQGLVECTKEDLPPMRDPQLRALRDSYQLALGKIAYRNGDLALALATYASIDRSSEPTFSAAQECIALVRERRSQ